MSHRAVTSVRQSVRAALRRHQRVVLAVSGGLDSMTLLDAAAASVPRETLVVATFDHGTGPAATSSAALVARVAESLGIQCVSGRAASGLTSEASLRDARWAFLRAVAADSGAVICTAHTEDDQVETILMRVLRGAGPRGLAALNAESGVLRPLVSVRRRSLVTYARMQGLTWLDDPSNGSPIYLRNRVRADLLPALRRVRPRIEDELLSVSRKASAWRRDVEAIADDAGAGLTGGGIDVPVEFLCGALSARLFWPPLAARAGVVLDRRGIERLADFTAHARVGSRIQLAGGWEVVRSREAFQLRPVSVETLPTPELLGLSDSTRCGDWSFRADSAPNTATPDSWTAWLPTDQELTVRPWQAGDAMRSVEGETASRKVKRLLSEAGVTGHIRAGWPVVLSGDQIIWIPGVGRSDAATARPGRPGLLFLCEYIHR